MSKIIMFAKSDEESDDAEEFATWEDTTIPTNNGIVALLPSMTGWPHCTFWGIGAITFQVAGDNDTQVLIVAIPVEDEAKACLKARQGEQPRPEDLT